MRAIILAAGEGTRLRPHTADRPKCMVELAGRPLIHYQIQALKKAGVGEITLVTGYRAEQLDRWSDSLRHNSDFASTNMVRSLMCAADRLDGGDDVLICYADIVYEPRVVAAILACGEPLSITVDRQWRRLWELRSADPLSDAETLRLDANGDVLELGKRPESLDEIEGQYMGLIQVRGDFAPRLIETYKAMDPHGTYDGKDLANMYMTSFLQHLIDTGHPLRAVVVDGGWLEVDTTEDLDLFNAMQRDGRLEKFCRLVESL